ncbi:1-deoxy-D-xylulose-5-phosphate synthase [Anaerospora hongkongensis]|uniref:1-deoxy-D-xylulose-5-phosphate synthase n=1 Tax=Anaerospora hongkongensis TaxID=244830 RepID=A0A4R1PUZ3_9FIRM|nr:1-deoxy-D-xylulose-5-phosphate synthase [Anaerospora hongkongensis]TCL35877.1 1-deoxy-D-xylulose-5-phosphate synthase [Anaerospora hongkongensis]
MVTVLDTIEQPQDLKKLSFSQLEKLAGEIRHLIIQTIAKNGGHLAPNLGVVELTLALHKVFDSPKDKFIWDVGHQAYIHKILTGRRTKFGSIRQLNGISGFPKRNESQHDAFGTGHSSTSLSAALGLALARDLSGQKSHVLAIIGDGSLTGGQAFEALNHAGHLGTRMTVILNDNEMSIAKNVGALSEYLSKMRTTSTYSKVKHDIEYLLRRIPAIGDSVAKTAERVKDSLKYLLVPGVFFEELGFTYLGPIDGHNINSLIEVLQQTKNIDGPVLIHVITQKGKGYQPAECNAAQFHGVGPFCVETGAISKSNGNPTYTGVFGDTLIKLAESDPDIVAITAAMPEGTGLKKFASQYPKRFWDVGIAEQHAVTMAAGLAAAGKKPVVALYSTFLQRAYDQVLHDVCLQKLPVIFALDRAGIVGEDGPTHHGVFDFSFLRHIPNIIVMAPKDEAELRNMMTTAVHTNAPVAIRYPRGSGTGADITKELEILPVGKAEELIHEGTMALLAIGAMVDPCLQAAGLLAQKGISCRVINARYLKPLDGELIRRLARETGAIVTVEDNSLAGGFGSAVLEYINTNNLNWVKILRLGWSDQFIEQGSRSELLAKYGMTPEGIAESVYSFHQQFGVR